MTAAGYSSSSKLGLWGRSAGGLTLGAALNMQPSVAAAAVLDVPFLDVLGDMCDPDLPLTVKERGEWGDPLASQVSGQGPGRVQAAYPRQVGTHRRLGLRTRLVIPE
jgi:oligopeptidase B